MRHKSQSPTAGNVTAGGVCLSRDTLLREAFVSRGTRYCGRRLSLAGQVRISPDTVKSRGTRLSTAGHARLPRETLASRETRSPTAGDARLSRDTLAYRGTRSPTAGHARLPRYTSAYRGIRCLPQLLPDTILYAVRLHCSGQN